MKLTNLDIRQKISENGLKMWEVADRYGLQDGNFSRKLRKELPEKEKKQIFSIINNLITEKGEDA